MQDSRPDLSALIQRPETVSRARILRAAWLLPASIFGGFTLFFLLLFKDQLIPARAVTVTPAIALSTSPEPSGDASATEAPPATPPADGELLFQASGWIEPDPLPIKATALTDGFVDQVHVLEGDLVQQGDVIATLIDIDAELARNAAASRIDILKAELQAQSQEVEIARRNLDAERAGLKSDQADAAEAQDRLERANQITGNALPETERVSARLGLERKLAAITAREASILRIELEIQRANHQTIALQAGLRAAEIQLAQAELAYQRTRIAAPVSGRILRLLAAPGQKKMAEMDDMDSSTIAILYQPDSLQVRVDVPLADAAALAPGQRARIRCNLLPDQIFHGEVTRIAGEADIQRNSLQAKVRILDPTDQLRPEMLCRVEFLETIRQADTTANRSSAPGSPLAVHVPLAAIRDQHLWVCDPETRRVSHRKVTPLGDGRDGFQRLESGVLPGEWIVLDPDNLKPNQRVNPTLQ